MNVTVIGPGRVVQGSFECSSSCVWTGDGSEAVTFEAAPDAGGILVAWGGVCPVLAEDCTRTFEDGDTLTATFARHALRLHLNGDGEGEFRIQGGEIDFGCTEDCAVGLSQALSLAIIYSAQGGRGTVLDDWGGACSGASMPDYCLAPVEGATDVSKTWRRPPVAIDNAYATTRNAPLSISGEEGVLANDDDTPGDTLTAERVNDVTYGTLALAADGSFTYTPDDDFSGAETFTYRARDAFGNLSNTATVTITVTISTTEAAANSYVTALNTPLTAPAPGVLSSDRDPDGDTLTIVDPTPVNVATPALEPDGSFNNTPEPDFIGLATFTYRVSDEESPELVLISSPIPS